MCLQKYRADSSEQQRDGATLWFANWLGGTTLSKITNCCWSSVEGSPRVTVYIRGESDTYISQPAATYYMGCTIRGYVTSDDGVLVFHHCLY